MISVSLLGQTHLVSQRIGRMICWLAKHSDELSQPNHLLIEFHCAGRTVIAEYPHREDLGTDDLNDRMR